MKLKFKQQQYQTDAVNSVIKCFEGQTKGLKKEIISREKTKILDFEYIRVNEIFSNKKIELTNEELLENIQNIQKKQEIKVIDNLTSKNFTIEMETGTGKTYVYTKTMFELNRKYGWNKFIIIVPSIAIREGVNKSLQITEKHFYQLYNKKIRFNIYNIKNKSKLNNIKTFASTANIEVLIMNFQAFNVKSKEVRKIYQKLDTLQSERPIDIIKRAKPILIIDEPQKLGKNANKMLKEFNPLFILRYSATHKKGEEFNKIYQLDAIDAYNQKLVKRINVKGIEVVGHTESASYLYLEKINVSLKSYPTASIEMEIKQSNSIVKKIKKIKREDNLHVISNKLKQYKHFIVKEINALTNTVTFTNGIELSVGQIINDLDEKHIKRIQIRETIRSHFEKQEFLFKKGIKVLSLFFIDEVKKYRDYEKIDTKGEYAKIFEEEFRNIKDEMKHLFNKEYFAYLNSFEIDRLHQGYFSVDNKGKFINSKKPKVKKELIQSTDRTAYDLIMKNKERLLSFDEPTRFIFSHSALREGWDNPNIFQICTLKKSSSDISRRQELGRGLRICVDKDGNRKDYTDLKNEFFNYNTLTVIASESYDKFAKELQNEILNSLSERPIIVTFDVFKDIILKNEYGKEFVFDETTAMDLIVDLKNNGYLDKKDKITEKLINDIKSNNFEVIEELQDFKKEVINIIDKINISTTLKNMINNEKSNNVDEANIQPNENFYKQEFQDLWKKIKIKTRYEVNFSDSELIKNCVKNINENLEVKTVKVVISEGRQKEKISEHELKDGASMEKVKVSSKLRKQYAKTESILGDTKYDLIGEITKVCKITRKTVVKILKNIDKEKFNQFKINPEDFIQKITKIINNEKATTLINCITYHKTENVYEDNIFDVNSLKGSFNKNILKVKRHIYDYLKTDSKKEIEFAQDMEKGEILVYAKLPNSFKISTPIGSYNPDWAIVFEKEDVKYIYFVAETKGSMDSMQLRESEKLKINYARKHFEALDHQNIKYDVVTDYDVLMNKVMK